MRELTFQEKYNAIGRKDARYEGTFITAVKTTKIFCRPVCRAKKPKSENVEFFTSTQQALKHGYRPCKLCRPMENLDETPVYIKNILDILQQDPSARIKDCHLRDRGIDPYKVRRWFKKHHNMTFHSYQRMIRINTAYQTINNGKSVIHSAMDSGYDSLSGFNQRYQSIFGTTPSKNLDARVLNITRLTTPVGPMFAVASNRGLCLLEYTDRRMLEREFKDLCKRLNATILPGNNEHLDQTRIELHEYFSGQRKSFTVALDTPGSDFQREVWDILQRIPYGKTWSYRQQAEKLGKSGSVRAVANANGQNRISIIIPCHRVIASDGKLAGYGGGIQRKEWLLNFEQSNI